MEDNPADSNYGNDNPSSQFDIPATNTIIPSIGTDAHQFSSQMDNIEYIIIIFIAICFNYFI